MPKQKLKKSARTRAFIVEKAAPIFNKKGFAGTSLQDIIEATGLTKGSIYGNFKDKDELATAAFEFNSRQILDRIKPLVLSDNPAPHKLYEITAFYRQFLYDPGLSGGCPLLNTAVEADDTHLVLGNTVKQSLDYLRRSFIYVIEQGKENRDFQLHVDTERLATIFVALIEGGIMQTKLYNKSKYLLDCLLQIDMMVDEMKQ